VKVLHPRCAGLDVHKDTVVACARIAQVEGGARHEVVTFGTTTRELLRLSDWLTAHGCTHVVLEATGVYWKPVWQVLEGSFELVLVNPGHVRNVPGRKTDVNDATWLADLLAHGLVEASFVPPVAIQELRTLTRTRTQLVRERAQHVQRLQRTLETANVKLASVLSDIVGQSGRAMLKALIAGETDPEVLAALGHHRLRSLQAERVEALRGRVTPHHQFLLKLHLDQVESLERTLAELEAEIERAFEPFRRPFEHLQTIPGVRHVVARIVLAEIGTDMSRFPTVGHLISWAGLCPRNDESAGKRRSTRVRPATPWLKVALIQAAWSAVRMENTYLRAQFLRIRSRRGSRKAVVAVAASILTAAYHILRDDVDYRDLGPDHFDRRERAHRTKHLVQRLRDLGYEVTLRDAAA